VLLLLLCGFVVLGAGAMRCEAEPVEVTVTTSQPGIAISPGMVGLSFETGLMLKGADGHRYFSADNTPLITLFKTIGVKSLRIGGSSVDAPRFAVPGEEDVAAFFEFAKAAGVKVIYSVRLEESAGTTGAENATSAAKLAKLIHDHYAAQLDCFSIGNEPSYFKDYAVYSAKWKAIRDAIVGVYPGARFCGPDQNPSPSLDLKMAHEFGSGSGGLVEVSQHSYPFGCSFKNPKDKDDVRKLIPFDAAASREKMLAPDAYAIYSKIHKGINDAIVGTSLSYRLSETNSYWFSGLAGASDRYAAALWAVDYLHWWAAHGVEGLNFHTGDRTGGEPSMPCHYAAFVTSGSGYDARPLAYGMKLFDLGGEGRSVPIEIAPAVDQTLAAYATLWSDDQTVSITLINKAHGANAKTQPVRIQLDAPIAQIPQAIYLQAKNDDIADEAADMRLGDDTIKSDGTWNGEWAALSRGEAGGSVVDISLRPASAAVVKVRIVPVEGKRPEQ
jgi:hypothetical protein